MRDETMCAKCQHPAHDDICAVGDTEWECGCSNVTAPAPRGDAPRAEPKLLRGAAEIDAAFAAAGIPKHDLRATFGSRPPAPRDDAAGGDAAITLSQPCEAIAGKRCQRYSSSNPGGWRCMDCDRELPDYPPIETVLDALATERAAHERTKAERGYALAEATRSLRADNTRLADALGRALDVMGQYARHPESCAWLRGPACDCGLAREEAAIRAATRQPEDRTDGRADMTELEAVALILALDKQMPPRDELLPVIQRANRETAALTARAEAAERDVARYRELRRMLFEDWLTVEEMRCFAPGSIDSGLDRIAAARPTGAGGET